MSRKIIYLLGAGRSGSTLLEIMIGNAPQIFIAGELNRYHQRQGKFYHPDREHPGYPFWQAYEEKLKRYFGGEFNHDSFFKLQRRFEYHSGFYRYWLLNLYRKDFERYQQRLAASLDILFEHCNKPVIIDSSKYPGRAMALSFLTGFQVYYIYLVRHPVGVVRSFGKKDVEQPPKPWLSANAYYSTANALSRLALRHLRKHHPVFKLRFEELLSQPARTLEALSGFLQEDLSIPVQKIKTNQLFDTGYPFEGNRLRFKNSIYLQTEQPFSHLSFRDRMTQIINGLWWKLL